METGLFTQAKHDSSSNAIGKHSGLIKSNSDTEWLDQLPVKIIVADSEGKAEYWNKQWYTYTGLPTDFPKNKLWKAALHPDDIQRTYNAMLFSIRTGNELQIEYRLKRGSDGQYRWHFAQAYPVKDSKNKVSAWLVTVTDIHEQKEAEYNKDIFLSVAGHELKTPLTTLKTLLHLCKQEATTNDNNCQTIFEHAENQLLRMERLVGNLLDVSKINAHKLICRFEEFGFDEMITESVGRMQQQSDKHAIVLVQNDKVLITGDKLRLEQIMNNILSNAIKYSPDANQIIVKSYVVQNEVHVSVQDFGIGIAPENLGNIYNAYYRANNSSADIQGLGIGLYICSEIIKNHLGKIWVESVPAKGSIFYFSVPTNRHSPLQMKTDVAFAVGN